MSFYLELVGWALPIEVGGACLALLTTAYVSPMLDCESLWTNRQRGTWDNMEVGHCKKEAEGQIVFVTHCMGEKIYHVMWRKHKH